MPWGWIGFGIAVFAAGLLGFLAACLCCAASRRIECEECRP